MKKNIEQMTIWNFKYENKITAKDIRLLIEAFRRRHFLGNSNGWLGLGSPSQYKSKFFICIHNEIPRVSNWYKLTSEGEEMMKRLESYFKIPKQPKERQQVNEMLFSF